MLLNVRQAVFGLICCTSILSAQGGYAILSGRVKDSSGALVPGSSISVENINTNVVVSAVSNAEGYYTFANLIPGSYRLIAEARGFKRSERTNLLLRLATT